MDQKSMWESELQHWNRPKIIYCTDAIKACLFSLSHAKPSWITIAGISWGPKLGGKGHLPLCAGPCFGPCLLAFLDWECPVLEEHRQRKNSTLLDTSKAVSIEKAPQFPNLSAILGEFPHYFFSCQEKTLIYVGKS